MRGNEGLLKNDRILRIQAGRDEIGREFRDLFALFLGGVVFGQRVQIRQKEIAIVFARVLKLYEIPESPQVITQMHPPGGLEDRKSTRLNSSHSQISYAVFF